MLEFELMCRHAILTRDETTQVSNTAVVFTKVFTPLIERTNVSKANIVEAVTQTEPMK